MWWKKPHKFHKTEIDTWQSGKSSDSIENTKGFNSVNIFTRASNYISPFFILNIYNFNYDMINW